jgi:uncharacterized protein (TIGR02466 family)
MQEERPFRNLLWRGRYEWDSDFIIPYCWELVNGNKTPPNPVEGNTGTSLESRKKPHLMKEFADYYKWLGPHVYNILYKQWRMTDYEYEVNHSWVNWQDYGSRTLPHIHRGQVIVACSYISVPENSGYLEIQDPLEPFWRMTPNEDNNEGWYQIPLQSGDVIIFPGWLNHRTGVHNGTPGQLRWVVNSNMTPIPNSKFRGKI